MGDNFGLNDSYTYYEFELDSLDATCAYKGDSSATDWPLFDIAAKGPLDNVAAIKVLEVQIPFSWYVINDVNNSFVLNETGGYTQTVFLPIGNFTATELTANLAAALNVATSNATYNAIYNYNTQKITIYNNTTTSQPFSLTFGAPAGVPGVQPNSGNKNPRLYIGFPPGTTSSSSFIPGATAGVAGVLGNVLTTPNAILASGPNYLYLNSQKIGSDVDVFLPSGAFNLGGGKAGPQIAKIPIYDNSSGIVLWQDPDPQKWFKYDQLQSFTSVDFYLTLGNTSGQTPLKLNGLSFSIKLGILKRQDTLVQHGGQVASNGRVFKREGPKRIRGTY